MKERKKGKEGGRIVDESKEAKKGRERGERGGVTQVSNTHGGGERKMGKTWWMKRENGQYSRRTTKEGE